MFDGSMLQRARTRKLTSEDAVNTVTHFRSILNQQRVAVTESFEEDSVVEVPVAIDPDNPTMESPLYLCTLLRTFLSYEWHVIIPMQQAPDSPSGEQVLEMAKDSFTLMLPGTEIPTERYIVACSTAEGLDELPPEVERKDGSSLAVSMLGAELVAGMFRASEKERGSGIDILGFTLDPTPGCLTTLADLPTIAMMKFFADVVMTERAMYDQVSLMQKVEASPNKDTAFDEAKKKKSQEYVHKLFTRESYWVLLVEKEKSTETVPLDVRDDVGNAYTLVFTSPDLAERYYIQNKLENPDTVKYMRIEAWPGQQLKDNMKQKSPTLKVPCGYWINPPSDPSAVATMTDGDDVYLAGMRFPHAIMQRMYQVLNRMKRDF
jgi:hypothetical protein